MTGNRTKERAGEGYQVNGALNPKSARAVASWRCKRTAMMVGPTSFANQGSGATFFSCTPDFLISLLQRAGVVRG
jgi:hypothetical protein